jgi:hypothetical protein
MGMASLAVDEEQLMNRLRWRIIPYVMFLYVVTIIDRESGQFRGTLFLWFPGGLYPLHGGGHVSHGRLCADDHHSDDMRSETPREGGYR